MKVVREGEVTGKEPMKPWALRVTTVVLLMPTTVYVLIIHL